MRIVQRQHRTDSFDLVFARPGLQRQCLDATHCAGPEISRLYAGKREVNGDMLFGIRERLVRLPTVAAVAATIDDINALASDQMVVAIAAGHRVIAVARGNAVVAVAGTDDEMLDAAEVDPVVIEGIITVEDPGITGRQSACQHDPAAADGIYRPNVAANGRPVDGQRVSARPHRHDVATACHRHRIAAGTGIDLIVVAVRIVQRQQCVDRLDRVVARSRLQRQCLDATYRPGPQIDELGLRLGQIEIEGLYRSGE